MATSLPEFKDRYLDRLLAFLWDQWSALGVAGYGITDDAWATDPEALVIFTCTLGRYDPRLFDEALDWINVNGKILNLQRLKTIAAREPFAGVPLLAPIAAVMKQDKKYLAWRWKNLASVPPPRAEESLFFQKDGAPMARYGTPEPVFHQYGYFRGKLELRGMTQPVRVAPNSGLLVKLRSLFGNTARAEIILYLLTHESGHPNEIARQTYYSQKTVQDTLVELAQSGLLGVSPKGKMKNYWVYPDKWREFLRLDQPPQWVCWPLLFRALERVWLLISPPDFLKLEPLFQSSEVRRLMTELKPALEASGLPVTLMDEKLYPGEAYLPVFLDDLDRVFCLCNIRET